VTHRQPVPHRQPKIHRQPVILSFDVEEHDRIEANAAHPFDPTARAHYAQRMDATTRQLLDELAAADVRATFFIVGEIARTHPELVRAIHAAGHEVAAHGYDHRRVHRFTPESFRQDIRRCCDELAALTGEPILGYRAPTFSIVRQTAWAIDVLAEEGICYDSSIFPVRHDRYGVPQAPRCPFVVHGERHQLIELPPATWRVMGINLPVGGGGYFRLFPLPVLQQGIRQLQRRYRCPAMLYFHPWEFDPQQRKLPLKRVSRWRTYVGIDRSLTKLRKLLRWRRFARAIDVVSSLDARALPTFTLTHARPSTREAAA
jgi:polysaccharide deacetylase family protein (PEP-CTERM system associated)